MEKALISALRKSVKVIGAFRRKISVVAVAVVVCIGLNSDIALAHNAFVSSTPANGAVLNSVPSHWTVTFTKSVPLSSASAQVVNGDGVRTTLGAPTHGATDNIVVFALPTNLSGSVTARWRLVGTDGHVISGRVSFTVQVAAQSTTTVASLPPNTTTPTVPGVTSPSVSTPSTVAPAANVSSDDDGTGVSEPSRFAVRMTNFLAVLLVGGILFSEWYIAAGTVRTIPGRRTLQASLIAVAVTPFIQYLTYVDDIRGFGGSFSSAVSDSLSMNPGLSLFIRTLAGVGLLLMARVLLTDPLRRVVAGQSLAALAVVYLLALAYGGHSRTESVPWLGVPADVLHVGGAAVWLGGLIAVVFVVAPAVGPHEGLVAFDRFGFAAERAVAVIAVTGVIQSVRLHGDVGSLFTSTHGLLLLVKLVLVALIIRHAARNRRILAQQRAAAVSSPARTRSILVRAALTETAFGIGVVGITSAMVAISPA